MYAILFSIKGRFLYMSIPLINIKLENQLIYDEITHADLETEE